MTRVRIARISLVALAGLVLAVSCAATHVQSGKKPLPPLEPDANMERSAVPDVYKWNLTQLAKDDAAWQQGMEACSKDLEVLPKTCQGLEDPKNLLACLQAFFGLDERVNRLTMRAKLRHDADNQDAAIKKEHGQALKLTDDLMQRSSTIRQDLLALTPDALAKAYSAQPKLKQYAPWLDDMFRRKGRVLDPEAERVLALAGDNLWAQIDLNEIPSASESAFFGLLTSIEFPKIKDEEQKEVQLGLSNYGKYRSSKDRRVRRDTVESFFGTLKKFQNAFSATLAGQAQFDVFLARSRKYDTARKAYLDKDQLDPAVYDNLIATVRKNLDPLHRYVKLRKRVMKLDEVRLFDLYVPLVPGVEKEISFDEAVKTILASLGPLGPEYRKQIAHAMDPRNGWLDLYPAKHKESGAFSASVYGRHPYVKMNYLDQLNDVSTLAHEYGHAMHSHLAMKNQSYVTFRYVPFLAEIASTFNEMLLSDYLLKKARDKKERAYLLNDLMESIRTTIYRQTLFAEFELAIHQEMEAGKPLTAARMNEIYKGLITDYYGPDYTIGENDDIEWAYIPHFYWKYYVFTYATGLSSAIALSERVKTGGKPEREAYLGMLKGGCSKPPLELLKGAGVDLSKPEAVQAAMDLFNKTLTELEKLL